MSLGNLDYLSKHLGIPLAELEKIYIPDGSLVVTSITDYCSSTVKNLENIELLVDNDLAVEYHCELHSVEYICQDCGESFDSADSHRQHELSTHIKVEDVFDFLSEDCNKDISEELSYRYLLRSQKRVKKNTACCSFCENEFATQKSLRCHEQIHQQCDKYYCNMCRYTTKIPKGLNEHLLIHERKLGFKDKLNHEIGSFKNEPDPEIDSFKIELDPDIGSFKCELDQEIDSFENDKVFVEDEEEENDYHCKLCRYKTDKLSKLKSHRKQHKIPECFICNHCGKSLKSKKTVSYHLIRFHSSKIQCRICQKKFINRKDQRRHMRTHKTGDYYCCDLCHYKTKDDLRLKDHKSRHLAPDCYICDHCGKSFKFKISIENHLVSYHSSEYQCQICQKRIVNKNKFWSHIETHKIGDYYHCDLCKYQAEDFFEIKNHKSRHFRPDCYICDHCGKSFKSKISMANHLVSYHSSEYHRQSCQKKIIDKNKLRPQKFTNKDKLQPHTKTQKIEGYYHCDLCKYKIKNPFLFKAHKSRHFRPDRYICDHCGRSFTIKKSIENHLAHYHNSKLECPICQEKSTNQSNLQLHIRAHRTGIFYNCDLCEYKTVNLLHLKNHKSCHPKPKPQFHCNYCCKYFTYKKCMTKHMNAYHRLKSQRQLVKRKARQ